MVRCKLWSMRSTLELSKSRTKCLQSPQWLFMPSKCIQPYLWSKRHLTARYLWCISSLAIKSILILAHAMVILTSDTECIDDETCRYNGLCKDGKCICLPGYFGPGCQCKLILLLKVIVLIFTVSFRPSMWWKSRMQWSW